MFGMGISVSMNLSISLSLYISIYKLIYGQRKRWWGEIRCVTLPVLSQIVKFEGQAVNSLIQLVIALALRDEPLLLAVLECLCEI